MNKDTFLRILDNSIKDLKKQKNYYGGRYLYFMKITGSNSNETLEAKSNKDQAIMDINSLNKIISSFLEDRVVNLSDEEIKDYSDYLEKTHLKNLEQLQYEKNIKDTELKKLLDEQEKRIELFIQSINNKEKELNYDEDISLQKRIEEQKRILGLLDKNISNENRLINENLNTKPEEIRTRLRDKINRMENKKSVEVHTRFPVNRIRKEIGLTKYMELSSLLKEYRSIIDNDDPSVNINISINNPIEILELFYGNNEYNEDRINSLEKSLLRLEERILRSKKRYDKDFTLDKMSDLVGLDDENKYIEFNKSYLKKHLNHSDTLKKSAFSKLKKTNSKGRKLKHKIFKTHDDYKEIIKIDESMSDKLIKIYKEIIEWYIYHKPYFKEFKYDISFESENELVKYLKRVDFFYKKFEICINKIKDIINESRSEIESIKNNNNNKKEEILEKIKEILGEEFENESIDDIYTEVTGNKIIKGKK